MYMHITEYLYITRLMCYALNTNLSQKSLNITIMVNYSFAIPCSGMFFSRMLNTDSVHEVIHRVRGYRK